MNRLGSDWRVIATGPAEESLVRIAAAATETESASGQRGYGAVMGSKKLRAIVVRGTIPLWITDSERFSRIAPWSEKKPMAPMDGPTNRSCIRIK